ncbi:MAG TPA: HPP family protein [Asticcacaulis sp.]|nr:HPP family protein [Asticcacaulis sp.]
MTFSPILKAFWPRPMNVSFGERLRASLGGAIGIALTGMICLSFAGQAHLSPWLVAPLGASAVLVFAVPSSPLAQPWSVVGGNTVSAVMGVAMCNLVPDPVMAAALAVGLAIAAMFTFRCLHPPGGAMALLVVLTHTKAPVFILFPACANSLLLVGAGLVWNNLTRRSYPHVAPVAAAAKSGLLRISEADLSAALSEQDEVLDIAADDLARLLARSEQLAWTRLAGQRLCGEAMTAPVHAVHFGTHLKDAYALMEKHDIKALPVTDRRRRVHGLLTRAAIEVEAARHGGLKAFLTPSGQAHSDMPEVAGQLMQEDVVTTRADTPLAEVTPLFARGDQRHVLVLDDDRRLVGIISASDAMRALYHAA